MDFQSFLKTEPHELFQRRETICFRGLGQGYPLLFFFELFKHVGDAQVEVARPAEENSADSFARLSTSFLGQTSFYWLKNISSLKGKKGKQLLTFLKSYQGPHGVAFFIDAVTGGSAKDYSVCIDIPEKIDQKTFVQLADFLGQTVTAPQVAALFKAVGAISLDTACLLLQYLQVTGRVANDFMKNWLHKIAEPEHSLTALSKSFFTRDARTFFAQWAQMGDAYPPQFWISFWSEQLWRAYNFVEQSRAHNFPEAKRVSFRLPYNFTQRLWRETRLPELRAAHDFLYSVDYSLKNGGAPFSLELFYFNFFTARSW